MADVSLSEEFVGHDGPITNLHFSSDYKYLLSSSQDSTIRIWSMKTSKEISKFEGHIGSVNSIAINSNNSEIVSGGSDYSVGWWDVERGCLIRKQRWHTGAVNSVCYNDNCEFTISGSFDSKVKIWDTRSLSSVQVLDDAKDSITAVATTRFEIVSCCVDGSLRIYDVRQGCLTTDKVSSSGIVSIEFSRDQQTMILSTMGSEVLLYVKMSGDTIQRYSGHQCSQYAIHSRFAADDGAVISGSENGEVLIWNLVEATVETRVKYNDSPILAVAAQNPFVSFAVGSSNGNIGIFRKAK